MSLEAWQNTWLALMSAPHERDAILASSSAALSNCEVQALYQTPQSRLEAIAEAVQRGRISVLTASLPGTLRQVLSPIECHSMAERYAYAYPNAVVYPPTQGLSRWLGWLNQLPEVNERPWLQALIQYEWLLTQLHFYRLPTASGPGPKLSPRAGLLVASPILDELVTAVETGATSQALADLWEERNPARENQGWLIARWQAEVQRIPLHWGVFLVLEQLDGQRTWHDCVTATVQTHPELWAQKDTLQAWRVWFEKHAFLA